jgi:hypothetical protein
MANSFQLNVRPPIKRVYIRKSDKRIREPTQLIMVKQIGTFTAEITDACMEGREVEGRNQENGVICWERDKCGHGDLILGR